MKIVFEVESVTQTIQGATVILQEPKDTAHAAGGSIYELQELAIYPQNELEVDRWVSRIGKKVYLTVEDL